MADDVTPAAPQKRGMGDWMRDHLVVSLIGALVLGLIIGASGSSEVATEPASETAAPAEEEEEPEPVQEEPELEPEPEPAYERPTKDDFSLKLRKVDEACFGSAGCLTDVRVILTNESGIELDPSKTYELRYRIVGASDPVLSTMEISGKSYTVNEHNLDTTQGAQLDAVVLSVSEF